MNPSGFADLLNTSTITTDQSIIYSLILPNLDANSVPYIDVNNVVQDRILNDGQILVGVTSGPPVAANITGTTNEIIVSNGPGSITISTPQPIGPTSDPTFSNLTVTTMNGKIGNDLVTGPASAVSDRLMVQPAKSSKIV